MDHYWNRIFDNGHKPKRQRIKSRRLQLEMLERRRMFVVGALAPTPKVHPREVLQGAALDGAVRVRAFNGGDVTGTLLSTGRHVLTTAHVLFHADPVTGKQVKTASTPVIFDLPGMAPITVTAANYRIPEDFVPGSEGFLQNDIAILILPQVVTGVPRYDINYDSNDGDTICFTLANDGSADYDASLYDMLSGRGTNS